MKIGEKLILGFMIIPFFVVIMGFIVTTESEKSLEKSIGGDFLILGTETINKVDRSIHTRVEEVQKLSRASYVIDFLTKSNQEFDEIQDVSSHINEIESEWESNPTFSEEILTNDVSKKFQEVTSFYVEKYGYPVFGEIFITNKHGVVVAKSGKTTDYLQSDEEWWNIGKKEGLHVSKIEYDKSAEIYSIAIVTRIDDNSGSFLGVMKVLLNIGEVITILQDLKLKQEAENHKTLQVRLINGDGKLLHSSDEFTLFEDYSMALNYPNPHGVFGADFFAVHPDAADGKEKIFAHAHSVGFRDFKGLGWMLLLSGETKEVFSSIKRLEKNITLSSIIISFVAVFLGLVISATISKPVKSLKKTAIEISQGNLKAVVSVNSKDEIQDLASAFSIMTKKLSNTQSKLNEFNQNLEKEVKKRTLQLERANKKIRKLLALKSQFVNQVAHDLRTPLVPLVGLLPILKEDISKGKTKENLEIIDTITANANYLSSLVNDTLNIARLDSGKLELKLASEPTKLIVDDMIKKNKLTFDIKGAKVINKVPKTIPNVFADKTRIIEVFENLIMNAIKFMPKKKKVTITAKLEKKFVVISIADTGIGMEKNQLKKIFDEFHTADPSRHRLSSGLGLSICKRIIKSHGGKIWAESQGLGKGSVFNFTLQIYKNQDTSKKYKVKIV